LSLESDTAESLQQALWHLRKAVEINPDDNLVLEMTALEEIARIEIALSQVPGVSLRAMLA